MQWSGQSTKHPAGFKLSNFWWMFAFLCAATLTNTAHADVYASIGADGTARYASEALDASYKLVHRESGADTQGRWSKRAPGTKRYLPSEDALNRIIDKVARQYSLSPALVRAVVAVESAYRPGAVSPKGALGAMQLMPATAAGYGLSQTEALNNPEKNIAAGARHLKRMLILHNNNTSLALAAYNAGDGAVKKHGTRIPPYPETMLYVAAVMAKVSSDHASAQ